MKIGTLHIEAPALYTDQTLQTASWYDRYVLLPGKYDIEYRQGHGVIFAIDAVLLESYRVNRVFQHSSAQLDRPLRVTKIRRGMYAYEFAKGVAQGEEIWNGQVTLEDNVRAVTRDITAEWSTSGRTLLTGELVIDGQRVA